MALFLFQMGGAIVAATKIAAGYGEIPLTATLAYGTMQTRIPTCISTKALQNLAQSTAKSALELATCMIK